MRIHKYDIELETITPLHVGQEVATKLTIIDHRVYRRVRIDRNKGRWVDEIAIPGSTIKGVFRHVFEDFLRSFIIDNICLDTILQILAHVIASIVEIDTELGKEKINIFNQFEKMLITTQNIVQAAYLLREAENIDSIDVGSLAETLFNYVNQITSLDNENRERVRRLCKLMILSLHEFLPLVCEPVGNFSCIPDTSLIEFGIDRAQTVRIIVNTILLRKTPLRVETCPSCILFGATGLASRLRFKDLKPGNDEELKVLPVVTRVAIDRFSKAAKRGKLFTLEYIPPGAKFKGEIHFTPLLDIDYELLNSGILENILQAIADEVSGKVPIGKHGSAGYGLVNITIERTSTARESSTDPNLSDVIKRFIREFYLPRILISRYCDSSNMSIDSYIDDIISIIMRSGVTSQEISKLRDSIGKMIEHRISVEKLIMNML